jgi:hypothetical protein
LDLKIMIFKKPKEEKARKDKDKDKNNVIK